MMVSLAEVWRDHGVTPDAVIGHSQGEIAAAAVSGALSLEDAAKVVALRSRAIGRVMSGRGSIVSIGLSAAEVQPRLDEWGDRLSLAATNGPRSRRRLRRPGGTGRVLRQARRTGRAGPPHRGGLRVALGPGRGHPRGRPQRPRRHHSAHATHTVPLDSHWRMDRREHRRRCTGSRTCARPCTSPWPSSELIAAGHQVFVEVSSHPVLTPGVQDALEGKRGVVTGTLRRDTDGLHRVHSSLAEVWVARLPVKWHLDRRPRRPAHLPVPARAVLDRPAAAPSRSTGLGPGRRRVLAGRRTVRPRHPHPEPAPRRSHPRRRPARAEHMAPEQPRPVHNGLLALPHDVETVA